MSEQISILSLADDLVSFLRHLLDLLLFALDKEFAFPVACCGLYLPQSHLCRAMWSGAQVYKHGPGRGRC